MVKTKPQKKSSTANDVNSSSSFITSAQNHDLKNSHSEKATSLVQTNMLRAARKSTAHDDSNRNANRGPPKTSATRPLTQQNFPWQLRERMRLLRAERDDAVRRELAVGTGPEVRRP